jgi:hypothetical protein
MTLAGSSELHEAINTVWDNSTLDASFTTLWESGESDLHSVLHDGDAGPEQPFPYCVFEVGPATTQSRMSYDGTDAKRYVQDVPVSFTVYAGKESGDGRTAKRIAADLAELVMKEFGGHPDTVPDALALDNASHLNTQYQNDFGLRLEDEVWSWRIDYLFTLDMPVAVA